MIHKVRYNYGLLIILFALTEFIILRPSNILVVVGRFPVKSETFIINQIVGLIKKDHNVSIYAFNKGDRDHMHSDIGKYNLLERTFYGKFPTHLQKCDIVLCQFADHGKKIFALDPIKKWLKGKKVVTCVRGSDITVRMVKRPKKYKKLFTKGVLFLPVCDYFKKLLISYGCPSHKIVTHHSAIDGDRFIFKQRSLPATGPINCISVCRLVEKKGIRYAVQAVAQAVKSYGTIHYLIIGDGPEKPYLEKLIKDLGMQNNIFLCGWKCQDEVISMLDRSHIFLLPSVTAANGNEEGIPNALKEAMAMGLPVIATNHAGNPELIDHGKNGLLVEQKNPSELSDALLYLINHPQEWNRLTTAARKKIDDEFEIKKNIDDLDILLG